MHFAYQRTGGPLLSWAGASPPSSSRAGETRSLGALGGVGKRTRMRRYARRVALNVPRPGAPEVISNYTSTEPGAATTPHGNDALDAITSPTARLAASAAGAYHGVKRNGGSIFWGMMWAGACHISPLFVVYAVAQGYGKPK